ncbi:ras-like protein [Neoconidiobolus thromboides FSU 785]|nr:ras-like protein [Neoconidiobolus thromboides FSU 785]
MHSLLEAKVVVLGSQGVGKSSLVLRYVQRTFSPNCPSTIGAAFSITKIVVDGCKVRLQIWDTAGQERFRSMAPMYYRGATAAILVYDITSEESFNDMNRWLDELKRNMSEDLIIHIVGNKMDLAEEGREVSLSKVYDYVRNELQAQYKIHEVSAKEDQGVDKLFLELTQELVEHKNRIESNQQAKASGKINVNPSTQSQTTTNSCCI